MSGWVLWHDWNDPSLGAVMPKMVTYPPPKVGDSIFLMDVSGEFGARCEVTGVKSGRGHYWVIECKKVGPVLYGHRCWEYEEDVG